MCRKKLITGVFIYIAAMAFLVFFVNYIVDPKMENNFIKHSFNEKKFDFGFYSSIGLYEKLKHDRYTLIFGTSRTARISDKLIGGKVLNFSTSIYGYPKKVYNLLSSLDENQLKNINEIYFLIDFHTFGNVVLDKNIDYNSKYKQFIYSMETFNANKVKSAFATIYSNIKGSDSYITDYGYEVVNSEPICDINKSIGDIKHFTTVVLDDVKYNDEAFLYLGKINEYCEKNHIRIVYFTAVFNNIMFDSLYKRGFVSYQFKKIADILPGFYAFVYMPKISSNYANFFDIGHYNMATQEYLFSLMSSDEGKEYLINKNNLDAYLTWLKNIDINLTAQQP